MNPVARPPVTFLPTEFEPEVWDLTVVKPAVEELANRVSIAFHNLVQKRADGNTVTEQHEAWANSVQMAVEAAANAWKEAKPVVQIDGAALVDGLYYKTLYDMLVNDAKLVQDALRDPKKCDELVHLKKIVSKCDSMTTDTTATLTPETDEAKAFVALTSYSFTKHEELKDPDPLTPVDAVAVPTEYHFRTGNQEKTKTSYFGGYYKIAGTIDYLESIAHRLHKLVRDLRADMRAACATGSLEEKNTLLLSQCEELGKLLTAHLDVLKSKPHSTHIHAGCYYLQGLTAQLATTKAAIAAFDAMKSERFGFCAKITANIVSCLDSGNLFPLYEAALLASSDPDAVPTLKEVISRKAETLLAPTLEESKVAALAFGDQPISVELISSYLTKGFIQSIFSNCSTPEFKLAVAKLSTTPQFAEALKRSEQLKLLHDHYFKVVRAHPHEMLLGILSRLYTPRSIETRPEVLALDHFMRFSQAEAELAQCRQLDPNHNPRIDYVQGCLDNIRKEWEKDANWQTDSIELLGALKTRFFDSNEEARKQADVTLENSLTQKLKLKPVVMALYFRWLLERFVTNIPKEPSGKIAQAINWLAEAVHEVTISESEVRQTDSFQRHLTYFFKEYTENPLWKGFFDLQYGPEYMERAQGAFKLQLSPE